MQNRSMWQIDSILKDNCDYGSIDWKQSNRINPHASATIWLAKSDPRRWATTQESSSLSMHFAQTTEFGRNYHAIWLPKQSTQPKRVSHYRTELLITEHFHWVPPIDLRSNMFRPAPNLRLISKKPQILETFEKHCFDSIDWISTDCKRLLSNPIICLASFVLPFRRQWQSTMKWKRSNQFGSIWMWIITFVVTLEHLRFGWKFTIFEKNISFFLRQLNRSKSVILTSNNYFYWNLFGCHFIR